MSSERDIPEAAAAWGTPSELYLSADMVSLKSQRPALPLTDVVAAAWSFVAALSPSMGLDYFVASAWPPVPTAEPKRLLALRLRGAVTSGFGDGKSQHDVVGWWTTVMREAFRVVHEVVASSQCDPREDAPAAATAFVALVLDKYLAIGNYGASNSKTALFIPCGSISLLSGEHRVKASFTMCSLLADDLQDDHDQGRGRGIS